MDPLSRAPRPGHRLPPWQRRALGGTGALLLLTGGLWLSLHYTVGAGAGELPHPLEAWSLRLHGLAAFLGIFVLGALGGSHVPQGWALSLRHGWTGQRRSGAWLCGLGGALVVTGYLLYYFAPDTVRPALGWVHTGIGVAMAALVLRHRRRRVP